MEYIFVVKMWNDTFYSIENIIKKNKETTIKNAVPKDKLETSNKINLMVSIGWYIQHVHIFEHYYMY